ncbi:MAG TPA: GntR family transcriptional regulator, partial [Armatimonadaceae bacterium]|nr:GntR family transcriptional regulator [Armatimonadaceae bacterium]
MTEFNTRNGGDGEAATAGTATASARSLYSAQERAERALRARIADGAYPPGSLLPTERQIVDEVGVSRPMVRAALQKLADDGWITREPGHRPRVARLLPAGSAPPAPFGVSAPALKAIAAIMPMDLTFPAAYSIQYGIQRTLQREESPYRLIVFDSLGGVQSERADTLRAGSERRILEVVAREGIAGVILWQIGGDATLPVLERLRAARIPVVFVDRFPASPGAPPCDFVGVDNRAGAREAVTHLVQCGHRRIAHLTHMDQCREGDSVPVRERHEGYRDALRQGGIAPDPSLVGGEAALLEKILSGGPDAPTAVFAVNDASANAFIEQLARAGKRVPEDVSVVGFDDLDRLSHRAPRLTTMYLPFESVGERAAELLLRRLRHPPAPGDPTCHL